MLPLMKYTKVVLNVSKELFLGIYYRRLNTDSFVIYKTVFSVTHINGESVFTPLRKDRRNILVAELDPQIKSSYERDGRYGEQFLLPTKWRKKDNLEKIKSMNLFDTQVLQTLLQPE
jgi:hypothetical protein